MDYKELMDYNALQYGHTRSGSTVVWQIVDKLFEGAKKTHSFIETDKPVIVTYRDFRASTISRWRIDKGHDRKISIKEIYQYSSILKAQVCILDRYKRVYGDKALFLKYEDCFNNNRRIIDSVCTKFSISITAAQREEIAQTSSLDNNKKISNQFNRFKVYDKETHIHGNHIFSNELDSWQELIENKNIYLLNTMLSTELHSWGYL